MLNEKVIQKVVCLLLQSSFDYFVFRFKATTENLSEKEVVEANSKTEKIVALEKVLRLKQCKTGKTQLSFACNFTFLCFRFCFTAPCTTTLRNFAHKVSLQLEPNPISITDSYLD